MASKRAPVSSFKRLFDKFKWVSTEFLFSINANLSPAVSVIPFYDKLRFFNLEILEFFMVYAYLVGFINSISTSSEVSV
jgi:hypothetical protein